MNIILFIGHLSGGGAENQFYQNAINLARRGHNIKLITLHKDYTDYPPNLNYDYLIQAKSKFSSINMPKLLVAAKRLYTIIKHDRPDIVYSALEINNFIAWLATRNQYKTRLIWGVRSSNMINPWKMAIPFKTCAMLSQTVPLLIANSYAGLNEHLNQGYKPKSSIVVPNGIDTEKYKPGPKNYPLRNKWDIPANYHLIGYVARLSPMKDHYTFLESAAILLQYRHDVMFLCAGDGSIDYKQNIQNYASQLDIENHVIWAGQIKNTTDIYNSLDIAVSTSQYGEGFSNTIGEAMACQIPCVVTDVGDARRIIGHNGIIVPPNDAKTFAESLLKMLEHSHDAQYTTHARHRIIKYYSLDKSLDDNLTAFRTLIGR